MEVEGERIVSTANIVAILKSLMRTVIRITIRLYLWYCMNPMICSKPLAAILERKIPLFSTKKNIT